ncbi:MAG: phosphate ABC transporter permease subunit PstC, partial [Coriobacteriales bacterium]|nr:phosphate ABC transporter permease subunit PstC [Coriobacteriales bacterium]
MATQQSLTGQAAGTQQVAGTPKSRISRRALRESVAHVIFALSACLCIVSVALICLFLLLNGVPALVQIGLPEFLFSATWRPDSNQFGVLTMIVGSLYVTAGAIIIGVPLGLLCALFLSRFASRRLVRLVRPGVELLAGIPSVVYGFFGLVMLVPLIRSSFNVQGMSILTASLILGV